MRIEIYLKVILLLFLPLTINAQIEYSNIYTPDGADDNVLFNALQAQADGSIIVGGYDIATSAGNYFLFKINPDGDVLWSRSY